MIKLNQSRSIWCRHNVTLKYVLILRILKVMRVCVEWSIKYVWIEM